MASEVAEYGVIGACLRYPEIIPEISTTVSPEDFDNKILCAIYCCIISLYDAQTIPTESNIYYQLEAVLSDPRKLKRYPYSELAFSKVPVNEISDLRERASTSFGARFDALVIRDQGVKSQLLRLSSDIKMITQKHEGGDAAAEELCRRINDIQMQVASGNCVHIVDALKEFNEWADKVASGEIPPGLKFGLADLDKWGTIRESDMVVVGARPSVGKTAFGLHVIRHLCSQGKRVLFFSLEQSQRSVVQRLLAAESSVHSSRIETMKLEGDDSLKIDEAEERMAKWEFIVDDSPSQKINAIIAKARKEKITHKIDAIVIDYLQYVFVDAGRSRQEDVAEISKKLKSLARELKVPVIVMAQLNRDADEKAPRLADLRESGAIEQDADMVVMLHRDPDKQDAANANYATIDLLLKKQREGPTSDDITVLYNKPFVRFENFAPEFPGNW